MKTNELKKVKAQVPTVLKLPNKNNETNFTQRYTQKAPGGTKSGFSGGL